MTRPGGGLDRSLAALTIGVAQGERQRRRALTDTRTGEYVQQLRVPLSGSASAVWSFSDSLVIWEMPFLYAPSQRRVPFQTPHFSPGIEITGDTTELVVIHAHVIDWSITDQGWYVGAKVRFAVVAPMAGGSTPFTAIAHLAFQGYATTPEDAG